MCVCVHVWSHCCGRGSVIRGFIPQRACSFQLLFLLGMWGGNWEKECVPHPSGDNSSFRDIFLEHATSNFTRGFIYVFQIFPCSIYYSRRGHAFAFVIMAWNKPLVSQIASVVLLKSKKLLINEGALKIALVLTALNNEHTEIKLFVINENSKGG